MYGSDVFGFDELDKAVNKAVKKYPDKADALLMAGGRLMTAETKKGTPVGKTKKLKPSWRTKKIKQYGSARVVRTESTAPHAHLIEDGHRIVRGGRIRGLNTLQMAARGITVKGFVPGTKMLEKAQKKTASTFYNNAEKLLDELLEDIEV